MFLAARAASDSHGVDDHSEDGDGAVCTLLLVHRTFGAVMVGTPCEKLVYSIWLHRSPQIPKTLCLDTPRSRGLARSFTSHRLPPQPLLGRNFAAPFGLKGSRSTMSLMP